MPTEPNSRSAIDPPLDANADPKGLTDAEFEELLRLIIDIQRGEGFNLTVPEIAIVRTNLLKQHGLAPASER